MKRKIIKKLAKKSFTKDKIDEKKVNMISNLLNKSDLKVYIKDLKNINSEKIVTVTVASEDGVDELNAYFRKVYPNKKIVVNTDPELINGVRVVDSNNEYEFSLKSFMEDAFKLTND
ncbi:MAG: hypothetical protein US96_C0013G0028 [Candidatus Woesebacteria bacterium GW2011_GWB1_38_5b]|uniref:ATP synthase subunit delta n=1 Tax=Candidatus Woesebacteria bacterium GW2011_GWB1_38_5b TaxID=1618569 RepID=A0A0G0MNT4_9BACT|nr:MAG: hypothetical protein US96_C0013G0028 [Candidatus Woesebacteria bacterium GW2011_GWB1_38_5b]OGH47726.1 MAG: hypothetical protein A3A51_04795 [Candidatus Levybacteria bacterium RIFCSPLOWO2_01_FULL_39_10]